MADELYTKSADSITFDNLIGRMPGVDIQIKPVTVQTGQGVLKRGTVLGIITVSGKAVLVNSANVDGSQTADCILTDDVDTTAADVVSSAYSAGTFNRAALTFGGTDTAAKHETRLRELGIYLTDYIPY